MNKSNVRPVTLIVCAIIALMLAIFWPRTPRSSVPEQVAPSASASDTNPASNSATGTRRKPFHSTASATSTPATAEEIVAVKLKRFAQSRRAIMRAMAQQKNITVPDVVERFFDAVESGDWNEIDAAFKAINGGDSSAGHEAKRLPEVTALWASIIDTYGVAEQVHEWPAQKLLDYGNALLGALRPGQVYVGGTDEGRWVPTLLNETSDGERHIVITQNGLADGTYQEYLRFLYPDRFRALSSEDSERAFKAYMESAQQRLDHDEQFPNEPKQIRPDEQIKRDNGRVSVSGMVAVMDINERLLRMLMDKNPDLSFALQESFPLKGTYDNAALLGPIMELRAADPASLTAERAGESVNYWREVAAEFHDAPGDTTSQNAVRSYSKLAVGQANLMAERGFAAAAEQTYRVALGMIPSSVDAVLGLAELFDRTGRANEARTLMDNFTRDYPKEAAALKRFRTSVTFSVSQ